MADYQVTCISKLRLEGSYADITHIGNPAQRWKMTKDEAIRLIDSKIHTFFIVNETTGITSQLAVVRPIGQHAYLRTHIDGEWNDELLLMEQYK